MGRGFRPTEAGEFVEIANLPTFYCSGVAHVSCDGPNLVFSIYQNRNALDGTTERVVVANVVIPRDAWLIGKDMALFELGKEEFAAPTTLIQMWT